MKQAKTRTLPLDEWSHRAMAVHPPGEVERAVEMIRNRIRHPNLFNAEHLELAIVQALDMVGHFPEVGPADSGVTIDDDGPATEWVED